MYHIVGQDGKIYGPVSPATLHEWIAQGRVDRRTMTLAEGRADWVFIGLLPEFAADFAPPPNASAPVPAPRRRTNGFATAGFICGALSLTGCCVPCCCLPMNLFGLVFSLIALVQIHQQPEKQAGWGLALAGLICSLLSLLLGLGFGLINLLGGTTVNVNGGAF